MRSNTRALRLRDLLLPAVLLVPVAVSALSAPAAAQNAQAQQMFQKACGGDVKKYCSDVQPGGGRIIQCIKANEASLSDTCKSALVQIKAQSGR